MCREMCIRDSFKKLLSCGYRMENYLKPDLTQEKTFQSLYFMNMHLTEVKLQEAAQKLFSDKSCGNVFRVKGFMKNEKEQWIELNATQKNLVISPTVSYTHLDVYKRQR